MYLILTANNGNEGGREWYWYTGKNYSSLSPQQVGHVTLTAEHFCQFIFDTPYHGQDEMGYSSKSA